MNVEQKMPRIKELRDAGLLEAKGIVRKECLHAAIDDAKTIDDLKAVLREIVH